MSRLRGPPTYRSQPGGIVHVETDNPGLLALLREQSSAKSRQPPGKSDPSPRPSQGASGSVGRKERRESARESGAFPSDVGRTVEGNSSDSNTFTERGVKDSTIPAEQISVHAETSSSRYVEAFIENTATSGPVAPADAHEEEKAEHKVRNEDCEEGSDNTGLGVSEACPNTESGQSGLKTEQGEHHRHGGPAASLALPDSDSAAGSSPPPTPLSSSAQWSVPDLNSPDHPRFLTPYSSRRLKDRPAAGKPVIAVFDEQGVRTKLSVPEDLRWSREQAARLKAGGTETAGSGAQAVQTVSSSLQKTPHPDSLPAFAGGDSVHSDRGSEEEGISSTYPQQGNVRNLTSDRNSTWKSHHQSLRHSQSLHRDHSGQSLSVPAEIHQSSHGHTVNSASEKYDRVNTDRGPQASVTVSEQLLPSPSQRSVGVERFYVDSPSFTQEEEEEYRFVSTQVDDEEELSEFHLVHGGLDQQALNKMAGTAATTIQPIRKPFKQVRYQDDEDRFEDREDILAYSSGARDLRPSAEAQTQYVLRSKTSSAKTLEDPPPRPARGLNLPSGPSYDPQDEEDLERETTYQQELRNRVDTLQREAEATVIPHIDPDSEDLPVDEDMDQDNSGYPQHRDSLTMYDGQRLPPSMQNTQWGDAPQPIYGNPHSYAAATHRGYADQEQQSYADLEGGSYADTERRGYGRTQMGYADPYNGERFEERGYPEMPQGQHPLHRAGDNYPQGQYGSGHQEPPPVRGYVQDGYAEPRDGYYLTEPRGYAQKPAPVYHPEEDEGAAPPAPDQPIDEDRYRVEDGMQRPSPGQLSGTITLPNRPDYDYVSHNKVDYGFSPKRTYVKIKEVKRREEERLSHFFVDPKVKVRGKKGSRDSSPSRPLALTYHAGEEAGALQGGPEEVWAQRSAHLAQANNVKLSPTHSPSYSYPGEIIQPTVTQHVVTEDGQRISVDVNLRLVSPPVGSEGDAYAAGQPQHFRQTGMQYPLAGVRTAREDVHSDSHDYTDPIYTTTVSPPNPFRKIPPIGAAPDDAPNSAPAESEGSYMLSYLREREKRVLSMEKPWYRIYGIKDYKRMQKEVQLGRGTLGPDLENDTFREKRDKMLRKLDYARAVKDRNMKELTARKPPSFPREKEQDDMLSKRKLAVEYAKHVPKPTVKPKASPANSYEMASKLSPIAKPDKKPRAGQDKATVEVLDLDKLQKRHQADKRSAEIIQQKAQGVAS